MKLVVANFKMNLLKKDISNYLSCAINKNNVVYCPPYLYLEDFLRKKYNVGVQNIGFSNCGAYTGDLSIHQLKEIGVKYAIVGHSERRKYYNDDLYVQAKVKLCLENDIIPIICIGENIEQKQNHLTFEVLQKQIDEALQNNKLNNKIIVAYEPIWSIGTGDVPENKYIYDIVNMIKKYIKDTYDIECQVLYGGSVNENNIDNLERIMNINGYLVGGCSLNVISFNKLVKKIV